MKICTKCNQEKSLDEFAKEKRNQDGRGTQCKKCCVIATLKSLAKKPKHHKAVSKLWRQSKKGRACLVQNMTNYRKRHPDRAKAHQLIDAATKSGKIIREPCEICANPKSEGHHEDYSKPLEVIWLCRKHHVQQHI